MRGPRAGSTGEVEGGDGPLDRLLSDGSLWEGPQGGDESPSRGRGDDGGSGAAGEVGRRGTPHPRGRSAHGAREGAASRDPAAAAERRRDLDALFADDASDGGDPEATGADDLDAILAALENEPQIDDAVPIGGAEDQAGPVERASTGAAEVAAPDKPVADGEATASHEASSASVVPDWTAWTAGDAAIRVGRSASDGHDLNIEALPAGEFGEAERADTDERGKDPRETDSSDDRGTGPVRLPVPARPAVPPARILRPAPAGEPRAPGAAPPRRRNDPLDEVLNLGPKKRRRKTANRWLVRGVWAALIAALVWIAFQPYSFEVGGEFVVQPIDRAEVRARTDGEIVEILVMEGDWVEQGDVIAVLSNWDELREIALLEAEVAKLEADLDTLLAGATPEQIAAAEQRVETERVQVEIALANLARQQQLVEREVAPANTLQERADEARLAEAGLEEAQAALKVIRSGARESEVAAAQAAINRAKENLAFSRQQLEHTMIRATVDGQIVSSLSNVPVGAFLPEGGLFVELQDNRTVIVEIEVPETEIDEVEIGAGAELRPWSTPEQSIHGTVRSIAPMAAARDFGRVVRVLVEVPNDNGRLAANMTGYAKIDAEDRPVWQAFTRVFVRFFEVEIWSWLP